MKTLQNNIFSKFILLAIMLQAGTVFLFSSTLKVGVYDNSPKIFLDENGKPAGIFIDVINSVCNSNNFEVEYIHGNWDDLVNKLLLGEIDLLPDMSYSLQRDTLFSMTKLSVMSSWLEIFTINNSKSLKSIEDINGLKVGVLSGSIQEQYFDKVVKSDFKIDYQLYGYSSYQASVNALKNNEIDLVVADRFFYFSKLFEDRIFPTGIILRPAELFIAFRKDMDPELINSFDKQISILKNDPKSDYYKSLQKWLNKEYASNIPLSMIIMIIVILAVLIVTSVFAILLRYNVKRKTKELNEKNAELIYAKTKVEESDRLKTAFLQNMSHEIRTPLNGMLGFIQLLKYENINSNMKEEYIRNLETSSIRLFNTISDIIEVSKIQTGQVKCELSTFVFNDTIQMCAEYFRRQAFEKDLNYNLICKSDQEINIRTDRIKLESIINNLINNAIKFTNEGTISIEYGVVDSKLYISVSDTGIGIPKDKQYMIFESFIQGDTGLSRPYEGSGLGLSIVKYYVDIIGGKISLDSKPGIGSKFTIELPRETN
ncbi:MAG: transporter substrate-binding domain-containing protein [Candidatus Kapabacteria bacterium]|nr:transporter substrate-binding domain-containing protein [Ignavibacteriota bacterium]MCW5884635.1 transporter substrate-binding domain-containing protein [Candidatus Kapabacteria bacterium]